MPTLVCNTCNTEFPGEKAQKSHYRSDWHQYNLKRKLAGAPGVSETLFNLRLETLAAEKGKLEAEHLLYTCTVCNKQYRSSKAHAQHLRSKLHIQRALSSSNPSASMTITRPVPYQPMEVKQEQKVSKLPAQELENIDAHKKNEEHGGCQFQVIEGSGDEWEEVNDEVVSLDSFEMDDVDEKQGLEAGMFKVEDMDTWDATRCFFCDSISDGTIGGCVEHMHKEHGFFIPDTEYLKDPEGLLCYLSFKVTRDFRCLYCEDRGRQFQSLEAVRKHMASKSHCKLRYGDDAFEEELGDFYDFTSSYHPEDLHLVPTEDLAAVVPVALSNGGTELVIKHYSGKNQSSKTIGSREFMKYYRQKPRPSDIHDGILVNALVSRYKSMGLSTKHSQGGIRNIRETKKTSHFQADAMRTKLGLRNNIVKDLPRNVLY